MSVTATVTVARTGTMTTTTTTSMTGSQYVTCCPKCGYGAELPPFEETQAALLKAQQQIADLEAQVRLLNQKASAAVDRWADYEDELARLRAQLESRPQTPAAPATASSSLGSLSASILPSQTTPKALQLSALPTPPSSAAVPPSPSRASFLTTGAAARISALLTRRPATPAQTQPQQQQPPPQQQPQPTSSSKHGGGNAPTPPSSLPSSAQLTTEDLLAALSREQQLRQEAEGRLSQTSREIEELSASLFEQANEMVAQERRARARLEARVGELEKRDKDKRRRLERLEKAVARIERVRGVLQDGQGGEGQEK
ncbi:hypothetical protein VTJ04DRAFT_7909 [Mycothermus thermophilus]|uniref:uncharacterized protein n=1 Tax=Humicola insolens TaxID=85995 RepID=UPI003743B00A